MAIASNNQPHYNSSMGKSISIAVAIIAFSNILSKILALVRMRILAQIGGTSAQVDSYAFSFLLPELLNHFLAAGMLSITFIPLYQHYIIKGDRRRADYFFSNLITIGTTAFIICIGFGIVFAEKIVMLLAGSNINNPHDPSQLILTTRLTRIILPAQLCFFWGALLMGIQYSYKRFFLPSLAGVIYNAGIILGGLLLAPEIGIEGFSWGVLAGAFAGNFLIQLIGAVRAGIRYRFVMNFKDPDLLKYILLTIPLILALNMAFSNEFLFRFFGSRVPDGEGAIASLEYSWRIMYMIVSIFGQSLAAGFYPFVSQLVVENATERLHLLLRSVLIKIGAILFPVSGVMIVLSSHIVTVLLHTGQFNEQSIAATAAPLCFYLPATFFFAATPLINRIFYANKNTLVPLFISTGTVIASIPLYFVATKFMRTSGIALSSSISMTGQFFLIFTAYSIVYKNAHVVSFFKSILATMLIGALATTICVFAARMADGMAFLPDSLFLRSVTIILCASLPSLSVAALLLHITSLLDLKALLGSLMRKQSKPAV